MVTPTNTPPPPRSAPVFQEDDISGGRKYGTFTQPWSGWFRNLHNQVATGAIGGGGGGGSGTVTSVGVSSSSLAVTGSPITTAGVIDIELAAGSVTTAQLGNNIVTNAKLAQAGALTVKCNPTNTTANDQDLGPAAANQVLQSNGAGNALVWGPFGTGVQVRGATWNPLRGAGVNYMQDVSIVNPIDMQVTRVSILTKGGTGSCVCDCWTAPVASYPPTVANTIFSVLPSISSGIDYDDTVLSGVSTPHIPAGNVLTFHLTSTSGVFSEIVFQVALTPTQTVSAGGYTDAQAVAAVKAAMSNAGNVTTTGGVGVITQNFSALSQSLANNGWWQQSSGGLMLNWGRFTLPNTAPQTITFARAFPSNCFSCVCSQGDSAGYGYPFGVDTLSTVGFTVVNSAGGINAGTGYYIAIGN